MRAAHVIKGASANLMCHQLRTAAAQLEQAASVAHDAGGVAAPPDLQAAVQVRFGDLQQATLNYLAFLQSIGV
jgi:HPt (histidine-containing phosphotransfer) domain-containing protein